MPDPSSKSILPLPGLHPMVPFHDYAAWDAVNISKLKPMERTPMHCLHAMRSSDDDREAMLIGRAVHAAILEPAKFASEFVETPKIDRRTKAGRETMLDLREQFRGKTLIDTDQSALVSGIADAVRNVPAVRRLISSPGHCELSAVWIDGVTDMACKCRFDKLTEIGGRPVVIDIKTTRNAAWDAFSRDCYRYGYHAQAAWYLWGHRIVTGRDAAHVFVAVESEPPFAVAIYSLDDSSLQTGAAAWRRWLNQFSESTSTGVWPGYPEKVQTITLPPWAHHIEDHDN